MKQNIFQFKGIFYEQNEGTAMGNSLSPFIADLFMSRFEKDLQSELDYFPKVWLRYVDDIFAIFDTNICQIDDFISSLNHKFTSIKFTYELEKEGKLPFLDTLVIRNNNHLEFDVYRKESSTLRYIMSDSHHHPQHKMAAFNFLIHRLCTFPLNKKRYSKELHTIHDIAEYNGFDRKLVDKMVRKIQHKITLKKSSTFQKEPKVNHKFAIIPFEPRLTRGIGSIFKSLDLQVIFTSGPNLQNLLGNPKDKVGANEKSGIYEINCKDCSQKYIGQTKRPILTRFKEHLAHLKYGRLEKSSVAQHIFDNDHRIDLDNLKLIKHVNRINCLDSLESIEIYKNRDNVMNSDLGPIPRSALFSLLNVKRHSLSHSSD
jgi:hypothetical protein